MKKLKELSLEEYDKLKSSGLFWVLFPEATGNFERDKNPPKVITEDEYNKRQCIAAEQYVNRSSSRKR